MNAEQNPTVQDEARDPEFYKKLIESLDNNSVLRKRNNLGQYVPISCTREFAQMMECEPQEFLDAETKNPLSTVCEEDRDEAAFLLSNKMSKSGENHIIVRKKTFKGNLIWVDLHYAFFEHRGEHYAYCNYFDVTKIKENEQRMQAIYESMNQQLNALAEGSLTVMRSNITTGLLEEVSGHDLYNTDKVGAPIESLVKARLENMPIAADRKNYQELFKLDNLLEKYYNGEGMLSTVVLSRRQSGRLCFVKYTGMARQDPFTGDIIAYGIETEYNSEKVGEVLNQKILAKQYDMISYVVNGNYGVVIGDAASIKKGSIFPKKRNGLYSEYVEEQVIPAADEETHDKNELRKALDPKTVEEKLKKEEPYSVDVVCKIGGELFYKRFIFYEVERAAKFYILLKVDYTEIHREQTARNEHLKTALEEANQANIAKTAFLSNMSHEIRTPMNAIIGLGSIALKDPDLPQRTREYLEKIGGSARHLLNLINDILDMSRIESGRMVLKKEEFSFSAMLEQINTMINSQCVDRGLNYDCTITGKIDDFYIGDDMKLKQVLINILGNAVKFTPKGGEISFFVERTAQFDENSTIRFVIRDTGIGMDADYLPKIFDAFSQEDGAATNAYGGTGLGMAITKNIVEMMNGNISVKSEKGKGTEFTVNVTLRNADKKQTKQLDFNNGELNVLVIDDDPIACEHARLVLEEVGIAADVVMGGEEAIDMVRLRHARHEAYNLLLVDLHMPGQDGITVSKRVREISGNESAIIILTAYNWDDVMEEAIQVGVDGFMSKPIFASNVLDEFRKALAQKNISSVKEKHLADLTGKKILLAEDMFVNAEIMKELLKMKLMEVEHAENGQIAAEMFAKSPENYFDAILMDVRMPVMDGLEATKKIRSLDRADAKVVPIIAMTANAFDEDVQRSLQSGMNAHLSKPVEPERLYGTLAELIRE